MSKFSGLFAYSSSSSPAKNLHPLSYSPKGLSPSGISRYIYPTGRPSTVILSLAKHPPASFQSVRRSFMLFAGIKNFFSFFILFFFFAGNVQLTADLAVIFPKYSLFKFTFYQFQEFLLSHEPVEKILQSSLISYFREKFLMIRTPDDRILRVVI